MKKIEYSTKITVPFCDLDPMNVVWHGNYIKYLELARGKFFEHLGFGYIDMHNTGIAYPIAKMDLKFIAPASFNQELEVKCILEEIEPAIIIKYEIYDALTKEKLFKASSMQICVKPKTKETIYNAPERLVKAIESVNHD